MNQKHATALRNKHKLLSKQIEFEEARPAVNRGLVMSLKRERLKIKDSLAQFDTGRIRVSANG